MKRRSWNSTLPAPSKPMKRSAMPERKKRILPVSKANVARLFRRNFRSIERVRFAKAHDCQVCHRTASERWPGVNSHAVHSRGAGGDYRCVVALCVECDANAAARPRTFWMLMGMDPHELADELEADWQAYALEKGLAA